jgi:hypothetical protein
MPRITILTVILLAGCSTQQVDTLKNDVQQAEQVYAATTQASAAARAAVATLPADSPAAKSATGVIDKAESIEHVARTALDLAQAALDAAQKKDPTDPKLATAVSAAISAIPSPWTPVLASLVPATIPLIVSIVQSMKLGRAHQAVVQVTQQLEEHKAKLAEIQNAKT